MCYCWALLFATAVLDTPTCIVLLLLFHCNLVGQKEWWFGELTKQLLIFLISKLEQSNIIRWFVVMQMMSLTLDEENIAFVKRALLHAIYAFNNLTI